jgi:hypothetical protein
MVRDRVSEQCEVIKLWELANRNRLNAQTAFVEGVHFLEVGQSGWIFI